MASPIRKILSPVLLPLSLLYGFIVYLRNRLFDYGVFKSTSFNLPIISIGNLTVGGTGKTPHVEYLADLLQQEFNVATLSRGYKRKTRGFILADQQSTATEIGDEPRQIKQKFPHIEVAVDHKRVRGIQNLMRNKKDLDVILLDDAFQHRQVETNLSILLVDYNRPIGKDFMLPLGNLREQAFEKKRASIIIITKAPKNIQPIERRVLFNELHPFPFQDVYFTTFDYGNLTPVFGDSEVLSLEGEKPEILLVTGIANPSPLEEYLRENISDKINTLKFPDHYQFKKSDIQNIQHRFDTMASPNKIMITSEKDAMRFHKFTNIADNLKKSFFYIPIKVRFLNNKTDNFNQQIIDYVRNNKKHSFLYPG
ncbi:MAG: tetraacyldisaccharide 4'-kinase [Bacteroidales bacterium]|jgi:tetraacyldisaccharide 4'-kinase|nr:tetraacyldisaccharide 4'-kinase [Bacteroidales bacterium]